MTAPIPPLRLAELDAAEPDSGPEIEVPSGPETIRALRAALNTNQIPGDICQRRARGVR